MDVYGFFMSDYQITKCDVCGMHRACGIDKDWISKGWISATITCRSELAPKAIRELTPSFDYVVVKRDFCPECVVSLKGALEALWGFTPEAKVGK